MFVAYDLRSRALRVDWRKVNPASVLSSSLLLAAMDRVRGFANGRLLDVGCGSKPYRPLFHVDRYVGIDWHQAADKPSLECLAAASELPFKERSFDTVLCTEVIEHLKRPHDAIAEMARVLKPGGHLILSAPFVHELHEMPHDYFRFTVRGVQSLVEAEGVAIVELYARGGVGPVLVDLLGRVIISAQKRLYRLTAVPKPAQNLLVNVTAVWPQKIVASLTRLRNNDAIRIDPSAHERGPRITLGYVMVARKTVAPPSN